MSLGATQPTLTEPQRAAANIKRIAVEAKHSRYHDTTRARRGVRRQCCALFFRRLAPFVREITLFRQDKTSALQQGGDPSSQLAERRTS